MDQRDGGGLLTVEQAIEIIDAIPVFPRTKRCSLGEALSLVLARDLATDRDYPPFDKSQMDGFAVLAADVSGERATLRCLGEIPAGAGELTPIRSGETLAIMTGAPLPPGADAVIPVEQRIASSGQMVELRGPAKPGKFIARRGSERRAGEIVLKSGQRLEAAQLAVAATIGAREVEVFDRPRTAVLTTGDEVVSLDQPLQPHQIRNSNGIMLVSLLRRLGCEVNDLGAVRDDPMLIRDAIEHGLAADVLLVTGGMSMGEHDHVPRILQDIGVELKIRKLAIKPGKPFVFGTLRDKFVFGLPGNPLSGFVCTLRLCARLLDRLGGSIPREYVRRAKLQTPLPANGPREFYQPAILHDDQVQTLEWKSSGDVFTLAEANCLLVRPADDPPQDAGADVLTLEIP